MNIVHIYPNVFRMHGATKVLLLFATKLSEAGKSNTIVCGNFKIPVPYWFKGKIYSILPQKEKTQELNGTKKLLSILGELILSFVLPFYIPQKAEIIIFHSENSLLSIPLTRIIHRKAVLIYYCYQPPRELFDLKINSQKTYGCWFAIINPIIPLYKKIQTVLIRKAKFVLTWSTFSIEYAKAIYGPHDYKIVPAGVDFSNFNYSEDDKIKIKSIRKKLKLNNRQVLLINSSLTEKKNIPILLNLVKMLWNKNYSVHCLIIGEGPQKKTLEKLAKKMGIISHVTFLGFVFQEDLPLYYHMCDITYYLELRGLWTMSIIEAGAAKKPVIVAPGGSMPTLVLHGQTGFILTNIEDRKEIMQYTTLLLDDIPRSRKMGENNYIHSKQFEASKIAKNFIDIIGSV